MLSTTPPFKIYFNLMHIHVASGFLFTFVVLCEPTTSGLFSSCSPYSFPCLECYILSIMPNSIILFFLLPLQRYLLLLSSTHLICSFLSSLLTILLIHRRQENKNTLKLIGRVRLATPFILFIFHTSGPTPQIWVFITPFCSATQRCKDQPEFLPLR